MSPLSRASVTIVIPAKDEEGIIGDVVDAVRPFGDEILVVDGHSRDRTAAIAAAHGARVFQDGRLGKGEALRLALTEAVMDIVVFIDADGSHEPADIPALVRPIREDRADLVIGSRGKGGSDELHGTLEQFVRYVGSQLIMLAINYRWNVRLTDSQNGFRAIDRRVALSLRTEVELDHDRAGDADESSQAGLSGRRDSESRVRATMGIVEDLGVEALGRIPVVVRHEHLLTRPPRFPSTSRLE